MRDCERKWCCHLVRASGCLLRPACRLPSTYQTDIRLMGRSSRAVQGAAPSRSANRPVCSTSRIACRPAEANSCSSWALSMRSRAICASRGSAAGGRARPARNAGASRDRRQSTMWMEYRPSRSAPAKMHLGESPSSQGGQASCGAVTRASRSPDRSGHLFRHARRHPRRRASCLAPVGTGRHPGQFGEASAGGVQRRAADRETDLGDEG